MQESVIWKSTHPPNTLPGCPMLSCYSCLILNSSGILTELAIWSDFARSEDILRLTRMSILFLKNLFWPKFRKTLVVMKSCSNFTIMKNSTLAEHFQTGLWLSNISALMWTGLNLGTLQHLCQISWAILHESLNPLCFAFIPSLI